MTKTTSKSRPRKARAAKADRDSQPHSRTTTSTKKSQLISLLSRNKGADITSISKKFGWLPHTTRAALSRLRKAGYPISSAKSGAGKPTIYCIPGAPDEQSAR